MKDVGRSSAGILEHGKRVCLFKGEEWTRGTSPKLRQKLIERDRNRGKASLPNSQFLRPVGQPASFAQLQRGMPGLPVPDSLVENLAPIEGRLCPPPRKGRAGTFVWPS